MASRSRKRFSRLNPLPSRNKHATCRIGAGASSSQRCNNTKTSAHLQQYGTTRIVNAAFCLSVMDVALFPFWRATFYRCYLPLYCAAAHPLCLREMDCSSCLIAVAGDMRMLAYAAGDHSGGLSHKHKGAPATVSFPALRHFLFTTHPAVRFGDGTARR
jgi:hypothetical protein